MSLLSRNVENALTLKYAEIWVNKALGWFFSWLYYFFSWRILLYNVLVVISTWISHNYIYTHTHIYLPSFLGLSRWLSCKEATCQARDTGSTPGLGRSSGEENGNQLQYTCLGNPMDREAWQTPVHGVTGVGLNNSSPSFLSFSSLH